MMHYRHQQIHHQQMLVEQHPYYQQYAFNNVEAYYSSSDHQEEDNDQTGDEMPSETSGDQSPNADMFRLAFAASQWSKLVLNAEGLFNKLMSTSALAPNEQILLKNQIEQWLCMKQEYEECIAVDDSGSLQCYTRKSLERIEEVTETDEKTDESSNNWNKVQSAAKSCSGSESEQSDDEEQSDTDSEDTDFFDKLDDYMKKFKADTDKVIDSQRYDYQKLRNISPAPKPAINSSFVPIIKPIPIRKPTSRRTSILPNSEMSNELAEFQKQNSHIKLQQNNCDASPLFQDNPTKPGLNFDEELTKAMVKAQNSMHDSDHANLLKMLMQSNEEKQSQAKKNQHELNLALPQVAKLQHTIRLKVQLIEDLWQKFQKQKSKLDDKKCYAEKLLQEKRSKQQSRSTKRALERSFSDLTDSLNASKKEMGALKQQLKSEIKQKQSLEHELSTVQNKIQELEELTPKLTASKLLEMISESEDDKTKQKCDDTSDKDKMLVKATARMDLDDTDTLRREIRKFRYMKSRLNDVKNVYKSKNNERMLSMNERQRQVLIIDEIIDTIDTIMEQKNNMLSSTSDFGDNASSSKLDEQIPLKEIKDQLEKLSHSELMTLFYTYFYKVIDLKESSKNLETQNLNWERMLHEQMNLSALLKRENRDLKKQLAPFKPLWRAGAVESDSVQNSTKPELRPELMQLAIPQKTKVYRERNKLVFQTSEKKKTKK